MVRFARCTGCDEKCVTIDEDYEHLINPAYSRPWPLAFEDTIRQDPQLQKDLGCKGNPCLVEIDFKTYKEQRIENLETNLREIEKKLEVDNATDIS